MKGKNMILMLLIAFLMPWTAKAQNSFSYQEGFENYNNGVPTGWTVVTSSTARVGSTNAHNGTRSFGFIRAQNISGQFRNIVALPYFLHNSLFCGIITQLPKDINTQIV